jgi:hypothetical protein
LTRRNSVMRDKPDMAVASARVTVRGSGLTGHLL